MIKFEKVSFEEWVKEVPNIGLGCNLLKNLYDAIKLPQRSTSGSAGYDFYMPYDIGIIAGEWITIPTGIRFVTDQPNLVLLLVPRSGLGFRKQFRLANTVGVIDSDYAQSDNEGHIMAKVTVSDNFILGGGQAFMQGIIVPYITIDNDNVQTKRNGGFGSTDSAEVKNEKRI